MDLASTPDPPYTAVIFSSQRTEHDEEGYTEMAARMEELVTSQPGYLGHESARDVIGITVSYWASETDARRWKTVADHLAAQRHGRERWYASYRVRIATVHREYGASDSPHR